MAVEVQDRLTLDEFLGRPEIDESPAWELFDGMPLQKTMPGLQHSRLQGRLLSWINGLEGEFEAFPELRCSFGDRSIVPDIAIIPSEAIPLTETGEIASMGLMQAPPWLIEILSPGQSMTRVTRKLLHGLRHGTELAWLIDPAERVVLVFQCDRLPEEWPPQDLLPALSGLSLELTPEGLLGWLC
ncbi:Uma2 family endonuclease [Sodalinema gerasimenkoae]|uniref:Uma2 family endonuclease n=1 Tax=Sodalinema gerasimenkoae TaxID=2862348 RepID=UPI001357E3D5|nr:Uma2 family endonuclease [Sodalinema gerasimenkoae]